MVIKAVGVKALRDNLSRYLREVRSGTTVLVLDRDEVIAEIREPSADTYPGSKTTVADELAKSGKLIRARSPRKKLQPSSFSLPEGTAATILNADRSEDERPLR